MTSTTRHNGRRKPKRRRPELADWVEGKLAERPCHRCGKPFTPPPYASGSQQRSCGECQEREMQAAKQRRRRPRPRGSVWTVSGGLPTLGKRR